MKRKPVAPEDIATILQSPNVLDTVKELITKREEEAALQLIQNQKVSAPKATLDSMLLNFIRNPKELPDFDTFFRVVPPAPGDWSKIVYRWEPAILDALLPLIYKYPDNVAWDSFSTNAVSDTLKAIPPTKLDSIRLPHNLIPSFACLYLSVYKTKKYKRLCEILLSKYPLLSKIASYHEGDEWSGTPEEFLFVTGNNHLSSPIQEAFVGTKAVQQGIPIFGPNYPREIQTRARRTVLFLLKNFPSVDLESIHGSSTRPFDTLFLAKCLKDNIGTESIIEFLIKRQDNDDVLYALAWTYHKSFRSLLAQKLPFQVINSLCSIRNVGVRNQATSFPSIPKPDLQELRDHLPTDLSAIKAPSFIHNHHIHTLLELWPTEPEFGQWMQVLYPTKNSASVSYTFPNELETCFSILQHPYTPPEYRLALLCNYIQSILQPDRFTSIIRNSSCFGTHDRTTCRIALFQLWKNHPDLYSKLLRSAKYSPQLRENLSLLGYNFGIRAFIESRRMPPNHSVRITARLTNPKRRLKFLMLLAYYAKIDPAVYLQGWTLSPEEKAAVSYALVFL